MKATALFDSKGVFVGAIGMVRDITEEMGPEILKLPIKKPGVISPSATPPQPAGRLDKILGKARTLHRDGLVLLRQEAKYEDAIRLFDQAIEIDPAIAYVWHDRGVCFRELGNDEEAMRCLDKAAELDPNSEEILYTRAELLKRIGMLLERKSALESSARILNRILELNPNCAEAWNSLGICTKELGKVESSRQYFDKARTLIRTGKNINIRKRDL
jgi:Flp pilus assembly protein TadD